MDLIIKQRLMVLLENAINYILNTCINKGMSLEDSYREMKKNLGTSMYELRKLGIAEDWEVEQFDKEAEERKGQRAENIRIV